MMPPRSIYPSQVHYVRFGSSRTGHENAKHNDLEHLSIIPDEDKKAA